MQRLNCDRGRLGGGVSHRQFESLLLGQIAEGRIFSRPIRGQLSPETAALLPSLQNSATVFPALSAAVYLSRIFPPENILSRKFTSLRSGNRSDVVGYDGGWRSRAEATTCCFLIICRSRGYPKSSYFVSADSGANRSAGRSQAARPRHIRDTKIWPGLDSLVPFLHAREIRPHVREA